MRQLSTCLKPAYSIEEFYELVSLSRARVFVEIRERRLHAVKAGRRTLIPALEVSAWLERLPPARKAAPAKG